MDDEPTTSGGLQGLRAGSRLGQYRLKRLIGKGGFGHVWEAEDTAMDRVVALKLLKSDYSDNERFRQRLFREARAAGRLHDPHVVPIHGCGEIDGQLYIDMRLIEGTDLQTVLSRKGELATARAVAVVGQIAAALDAAHKAGLIHRDVKPANILLTEGDFACLVDFGLANAASDVTLTSSGTTIGTFAYMAPERLSAGGEIDHRADIYALTCVLYECLTGSPPYSGDLPALISAHLTAPIPRPSQRRPGIPVAFDGVIARGMAKKAEDRYASYGELAHADKRALTTPSEERADTAQSPTQAAVGALHKTVAAPTRAKPPTPAKSPSAAGKPQRPAERPPPEVAVTLRKPWWRRGVIMIPAVLVVIAGLVYISTPHRETSTPHSERSSGSSGGYKPQVDLPFTGLRSPCGVAVDTAGNVYVADPGSSPQVVKLTAGTTNQTVLFTGLSYPRGVAVDTAGNVYVVDWGSDQVVKLAAGTTNQTVLITGLSHPRGVAVDTAGNVYVAAWDRVVKLPTG